MTISFAVSDVGSPRQRLLPALARQEVLTSLLGGGVRGRGRELEPRKPVPPRRRVEALFESSRRLVNADDTHAIVKAAHDAFYDHYPLVLSPDAVWFCLAQGFAHHVALNAETLRHRFVRHEGKTKLAIVRPDFVLGQPNPWPEVFTAFSDQIAAHVGKLRDLVVADFSTTGPVERAASEVLLMDTFQAYFEYEVRYGCGIPQITLLGSVDDWRSVRQRAAMFAEFGLESWTRVLLPVLDRLVETADGRVDTTFWRSFFRYDSGSGGSAMTGWMLTLFPYTRTFDVRDRPSLVPNPHLASWEQDLDIATHRERGDMIDGLSIASIPGALASAPVVLVNERDGSKTDARFVAGLFGVTQDDAGALAPEFGWAVVLDGAKPRT